MTRWLFVPLLLSIACGSDGPPTGPTTNPYPLPAGAPSDAAAPAGTARVTMTTVEITDGGSRVAPNALKVNGPAGGYAMRVWIFCPAGLEGPTGEGSTREILDFVITKRDVSSNIGGTFSGTLRLDRGYNTIEDRLSMLRPGQQSIRIEIRRNFALVAVSEFVATYN
jgi:hypothetical protein